MRAQQEFDLEFDVRFVLNCFVDPIKSHTVHRQDLHAMFIHEPSNQSSRSWVKICLAH